MEVTLDLIIPLSRETQGRVTCNSSVALFEEFGSAAIRKPRKALPSRGADPQDEFVSYREAIRRCAGFDAAMLFEDVFTGVTVAVLAAAWREEADVVTFGAVRLRLFVDL